MLHSNKLKLEKLIGITEMIEVVNYRISNTQNNIKALQKKDFLGHLSHYNKRLEINTMVLKRLKAYYNNTLNKLKTL